MPYSDSTHIAAVCQPSIFDRKKKRPLLRGILVRLADWHDDERRPGYQWREVILAVFCPFCGRFHEHGWDSADDGRHKEYRNAHCGPDSPFWSAGYFVSTVLKGDPGYDCHVVKPGTAISRKTPEPKKKTRWQRARTHG